MVEKAQCSFFSMKLGDGDGVNQPHLTTTIGKTKQNKKKDESY